VNARLLQYATLLSLCFLFNCSPSNAVQLDSLQTKLEENIHDTVRVKVLLELSSADGMQKDDAEQYAWLALQIAEQNDYTRGIGLSKFQLIDLARSEAEIKKFFKETSSVFESLGDDLYQAKTYVQTSAAYLSIGSLIKCLQFSKRFLSSQFAEVDSMSTARAWNLIGEVYRITGNYDPAIDAYQKSWDYSKGEYFSATINTATVNMQQGNYDLAEQIYDSIISALKNDTLRNAYAYLLYRKSQLYLKQGQLPKAELLAERSSKIYKILNYKIGQVLVMNALCNIYHMRNKADASIAIGVNAIDIATSEQFYNEGVDKTASIVAGIYRLRQDFENAVMKE